MDVACSDLCQGESKKTSLAGGPGLDGLFLRAQTLPAVPTQTKQVSSGLPGTSTTAGFG